LDDTTVYIIEQTQCAQATLAAQYAQLLEQALHATLGTCASQGYTTAEGTKSITLPTVGEVTLSVFTKSSPRQLKSVAELKRIPANALAHEINARKTTWTAHESPRFTNASLADVKRLCGTVRPHETGFYQLPTKVFAPIDASAVPDSFDSRAQWPQCASVIGHIRDQSDCGSCWAFGSTEAFNDRRCIKTGDTTILSADDTTACCGFLQCQSMGCGGGQPGAAWSWFTHTGVVTGGDYGDNATCLPYAFPPCAHHVPATAKYPACPSSEYPSPKCSKQCASTSQYKTAYADDKHKASRAYSVSGAAAIQQEILANGPVTGAFTVYADFPTYRSGVYKHTSGDELGGHAIKIIGWGVDSGTPYWLVANSYELVATSRTNSCTHAPPTRARTHAYTHTQVLVCVCAFERECVSECVRACAVGTSSGETEASSRSFVAATSAASSRRFLRACREWPKTLISSLNQDCHLLTDKLPVS
jgi:cathepsin B